MNGNVFKMEIACRERNHVITDGLDDNEDI